MTEKNKDNIEILIAIQDKCWLEWCTEKKWKKLLHKIIKKVLNEIKIYAEIEVSVLLTGAAEIHNLNLKYRGNDKPTNVLSFPNLNKEDLSLLHKENHIYPVMIGDIVLAFEVLLEESLQEKKKFLDHFNHLVVHGILHLLGYDHESDEEWKNMRQKEIRILQALNINNPYQL